MEDVATPLDRGRYRLVGVLGRGGSTTVYRGVDTRTGEERAIKVLPPARAQHLITRRRFFREAETLALLRHPNVVAVHDFGEDQDQLYLVMDLMAGGSVARSLKRYGPLAEQAAVKLLLPVLDGLHATHAHGVIHRDVKPGNILLSLEGVPRLGDFGIVHVEEKPSLTATGAVMGSWPFMSPEQRASAKDVDVRSDVFSAGATLFALCRAAEPRDIDVGAQRERYCMGFTPSLWEVIARATERDPRRRYADVRALAAALAALVASEGALRDDSQGLSVAASGVTFELE